MRIAIIIVSILLFLPVIIIAQVEDYNIYKNWEFDDGTTDWSFVVNAEATASQIVDEDGILSGTNSLHWTIEVGGSAIWHIQTYQTAPIEESVEYFIDFLIYYEPAGGDELNVRVKWELSQDPYTAYFAEEFVLNTPFEPVRIQRTFISADEDETANCKIFFGNNNEVDVWLDRVYVGDVPLNDITGIKEQEPVLQLPASFELMQNYPNPFNPSTHISYSLHEPVHVSLEVFNQLGQLVNTLQDGSQSSGTYTVQWNGLDMNGIDVASGVYVIKMQAVGKNQVYTDFIKAIKIK